MNEILTDKIRSIADNEILLAALETLFSERIEKMKPNIGEANNDLIGQKYRAYEEAQRILKQVFLDISAYKSGNKKTNKFNKER